MELTKELKEKLENAESKEEEKKIIEKDGMELTDEEMEQVAGGGYMESISEIKRKYFGNSSNPNTGV